MRRRFEVARYRAAPGGAHTVERMSRRATRLALLTVLALVGLALATGALLSRDGAPASLEQAIGECQTLAPDALAGCLHSTLGDSLRRDGAKVTLEAYAKAMVGSPTLAAGCHAVVHDIGEQAWALLGDRAVVADLTVCDLGYYHALASAMSRTIGISDLSKRLMPLCASMGAKSDWAGGQCIHALGHAIGSQSPEIAQASQECLKVSTTHSDCMDGAAMELATRFTGDRDPMTVTAACLRLENTQQRHGCLVNSISIEMRDAPDDVLDAVALAWRRGCERGTVQDQEDCEFAIGLGLGLRILHDASQDGETRLLGRSDAICTLAACAKGVGAGVMELTRDKGAATLLCQQLSRAKQAACLTALREHHEVL